MIGPVYNEGRTIPRLAERYSTSGGKELVVHVDLDRDQIIISQFIGTEERKIMMNKHILERITRMVKLLEKVPTPKKKMGIKFFLRDFFETMTDALVWSAVIVVIILLIGWMFT